MTLEQESYQHFTLLNILAQWPPLDQIAKKRGFGMTRMSCEWKQSTEDMMMSMLGQVMLKSRIGCYEEGNSTETIMM